MIKSKSISITLSIACVFLMTFLGSCSLEDKIAGTWAISSYNELNPDGTQAGATNIGTMKFDDENGGYRKLEYNLMGMTSSEEGKFKYKLHDESVITIRAENKPTTSWIIVENKNKQQKWRSTDGQGKVTTLVLKKKDD